MATPENIVKDKTPFAKTIVAWILGSILVVVCYFVVDRPVAWFVHDHRFFGYAVLRWPWLISVWLQQVMPWAIVATVLWWLWKPGRLQTTFLAISASLIVTTCLKVLLKWGFGRSAAESWRDNPSLIGSGDYGFHPFRTGIGYDSFPSGHAAIVCSVLAILWLGYPRGRSLYAIVGVCVCVALAGMNYHFVGDVIAGVMLGSTTGIYIARLFRLQNLKPPQENDQ
jgi:membrane-associated phospholipid phosphatase